MNEVVSPQQHRNVLGWIGALSDPWKCARLKHCCALITDGSHFSPEQQNEGFPYVTVRDLNRGKIDLANASRISNEDFKALEKTGCRPQMGDVLFSKDGTIGKVAIVNDDSFVILSSLAILRPSAEVDSRYLAYFLTSQIGLDQMKSYLAGAALRRITLDVITDFIAILPPKNLQLFITNFLDREMERIDALIAKKERQIELLQEKRAALISYAVTKGLNPDAKMKDSGIEWLGEIPEHWIVCLLKRVADTMYGMSGELDRTLTDGMRILSLPNVTIDGDLLLDEVPFADVPEEQRSELQLHRGDLLFNWRNGSSSHLGKTAYFDLEGEYTHVSFLLRLRCNPERHDSRYFQRLLNGLRITGFFSSSKAGVNNTFNQSELANLWVMVPPLQEQRRIADYLESKTGRIRQLTVIIQQSIDKLHEYRTALISAMVTGKIDVRKEVA